MTKAINITIENKLVMEKRDMNVYHHGTRSAHMISYNSSITLPFRPVIEDDYLYISIVSGPGHLEGTCLVNLPSWVKFEHFSTGDATIYHSGDRTFLRIPPGVPGLDLKIHYSAPFPKKVSDWVDITTNDLYLIKQLEKEIKKELKQQEFEKIANMDRQGFVIDDYSNVIGLNLGYFQLKRLPNFLGIFGDLKSLSLFHNKIIDITALQGLTNLTSLDLRSNQITDITALQGLTNLTSLNLGTNQLTDITALQGMTKLTTLDLRSNQLTDVRPLQKLTELNSVDLTDNKIDQLQEKFLELGMDVKWNRDNHCGIFLSGNPIEIPPVEIVRRGNDAIREYFEGLKEGKKSLNEVKVLLVGDGGAGKTSLVKRILGKGFDKNEMQTDGINIGAWKIKMKNDTFKVHLWDFGGQEIMHATHQFFLSRRSLYILVLDGRKDEKTEYWLKLIESFGGDSPVLVVINKIDQNPGFEVNRKFLVKKYKNIKGFYRVSCRSYKGIKEFCSSLKDALLQIEILRTTWPESWFNVKTYLENMKENFISYDKYKEVCVGEKIIDSSSQDTLVEFLNDLGIILHFKDIELLDTHVLTPEWVTEGVYKIINSEELAKNKGVLNLELLDRILTRKKGDRFYYPSNKYRYIVELMKKFEICFEIDGQNVLVPDLLKVEESEFDFGYENSLKFVFDYDFLPRSIMPRFIVRLHNDIKKDCRWRTGVVLENMKYNTTAVVKVDNEEKKIYIFVNGDQKRDYFSVIRHTVQDINASFEKLEATELVPLPNNEEYTVKYKELIGHELANRVEYFCGELQKAYPIKKLLDGIEKSEERKDNKLKLDQYVPTIKQGSIKFESAPNFVKETKLWKIISRLGIILGILAALSAIIALLIQIF